MIKKLALPAGVLMALGWLYRDQGKRNDSLQLEHFTREEFGPYWPLMARETLLGLDRFRKALGYPVQISPARGALGRPVIGTENTEDKASSSWHNYLQHGKVFAVDVMPVWPNGGTGEERRQAFYAAQRAGFRGIGIYPDWKPRPGLHLDMRTDRTAQNPALWAGVLVDGKQKYVNINRGLV